MPVTRKGLTREYAILDKALMHDGIRLVFKGDKIERGKVVSLVQRLRMAIKFERDEAHELAPDDPSYGLSVYDGMTVYHESDFVVEIRRLAIEAETLEGETIGSV